MPIQINPQTEITMLPLEFVQVVNSVIHDAETTNGQGLIVNFRDPSYSAENGGFHPVEIHLDSDGNLLSLTDFAFFGMPPFTELGIELDWSFDAGSFRQFDAFYDLECGRALLGLYARNFASYFQSGVYRVEISSR
jgi:hypothetical protein